ncbi:ACP S-malonyltransferase [Kocuria tytonis]|uniref:[acyl-carrier-protein] S-malonyltransferase n=1 Tax=Kocuria tytonis TaxID=2054280 RepID=A0A495A9Q5_9MICC|nr:ACP S-malonyltransferase [Kocuria tytonis]RKQ36572.1 ACP S-malonyltransferase [Kocuria tytonis]
MIAVVCPGQGSQKPGFLTQWMDVDGVPEHLARLSDAAGLDLVHHGTEADEETIKDTAVAQPLIVAAGLVAGRLLAPQLEGRSDVVFAGHSVGEITAAALSGVLSEAEAMRFVRVRATEMARAAAATPTGMAAILGGTPDDVAAAVAAVGATAANANGGGQVVAAGTLEQLAALAENPPARAKVVQLKVAGAFHTEHMAPALQPLRELVPQLSPRDPVQPLLTNFDGSRLTSGGAVLESLVEQVCRPVRWDACMATLAELEVTRVVELPPAGTLVGLAKRGLKGVPAVAVNTPEDLQGVRSTLN